MPIFNRIFYVLKSKINNILEEFQNPLELLDQKIRDMEFALNEARISAVKVFGNTHEIDRRIGRLSKESNEYVEKIKLVLRSGNEPLAKEILQKKLDNDKYSASLISSYNNANEQCNSLKMKLRELERSVYEAKIYRSEAVARYNTVEAHKKISELIGNISTKSNCISLADIERSIEKKECYILGLEDLNNNSELNIQLDTLTSLDLDTELKKYM